MDLLRNITSKGSFNTESMLITCMVAMVLGLIIGFVHMKTSRYTKNFIITLTILPILVQTIIMLVNGNLGTSVAILGAFSLVRFRSMPGNSREIVLVFFAMIVGLALGTGYVILAVFLTVLVCLLVLILSKTPFGEPNSYERKLIILIPEDLNYKDIFDEIFVKYTKKHEMLRVKTVNMGSIFELEYRVILKKDIDEKKFIDELRIKNGNLKIILNIEPTNLEL